MASKFNYANEFLGKQSLLVFKIVLNVTSDAEVENRHKRIINLVSCFSTV